MRKVVICCIAALAIMVGCTSIDCSVNSTVLCSYRFMNAKGDSVMLGNPVSVVSARTIDGNDTVLINKLEKACTFRIPMSYSQDEDELRFEMIDTITKTVTTDIVKIQKTNQPHFESVDCNPAFFHTITGVTHTKNAIDSVVINNPNVDTDETKEHLYIYFHPHY